MAIPLKYQAKEVLNKVLNTAEDALNVDLTAGASAILVDDAAFTPGTSSVQMVGAEFDDGSPDSVDEGDAGAVRMSGRRELYTQIRDSAGGEVGAQVVTDNATASATPNVLLTGAHYKDALDTYADNDAAPLHVNSKGSLLTNLHDGTTAAGIDGTTGGLKVDLYGEGGATISASNPVFTELTDGSAAISTSNPLSVNITDGTNALVMQADADETEDERINAITSISTVYGFDSEGSTGAKLRAVQVAADNAGLSATPNVLVSGGIYKAALDTYADNDASPLHFDASGRLLISGDATLGTTTYSETSTKGITVGAVRNDTLATLANTDNEIAPLQVNAAGALYTSDASGEAGSIFVSGTNAITTTVISNTVFVAIQFITDSVFNSGNSGLISATNELYPSTQYTSTSIDADDGAVVDSVTFPQGMTIFGRWSGFQLASGKVIAYIGYV